MARFVWYSLLASVLFGASFYAGAIHTEHGSLSFALIIGIVIADVAAYRWMQRHPRARWVPWPLRSH